MTETTTTLVRLLIVQKIEEDLSGAALGFHEGGTGASPSATQTTRLTCAWLGAVKSASTPSASASARDRPSQH